MKNFASKLTRMCVAGNLSVDFKAIATVVACLMTQAAFAQCLEANRTPSAPAQSQARASSTAKGTAQIPRAVSTQGAISFDDFLAARNVQPKFSERSPRTAIQSETPVVPEAPNYVEPCYGGGSIVYAVNSLERVEVFGERMVIYEVWTQLTGTYFDRDYWPVEIEAGGSTPTPPAQPTTKLQRCQGRKAQCESDAQWDRDNAIQACNESITNSIRGSTAKALCRQAAQETFKFIRDNKCVAAYASCMSDPG